MKKTIPLVLVLALGLGLTKVANAKLVACVGASITAGHSLTTENSYPAQLQRVLRQYDEEWETRGFGVSGTVVIRNSPLTAYLRTSSCNLALASEPDVVVIQLGGNDSLPGVWAHKANFLSDFIALIDVFAELPNSPLIYIWIPTPIFSSPYGHNNSVIVNEIIPLIEELPEHRDVHLIDLYTPFEDKAQLFPDGIHPNAKGAGLIAEIVAEAIVGVSVPPDFNGDGKVDIKDLILLIENWGQNESLIDIAPIPFGDDIVDRQDLEVLMSYWGQDVNDPTLIAHWTLDETDGDIAYDSIDNHDGFINGNPIFHPDNGAVDGAFQFDGNDDYIETNFIFNPANGQFSLLLWIKGGAAGEVILSQKNSANWLVTDTSSGYLMTELNGTGREGAPLLSQISITDGEWHRIGLVWDGSNRTLYIDESVVAQDTQDGLQASDSGLYIGTGKAMESGTYWSGLIDDVRIYNRAINP